MLQALENRFIFQPCSAALNWQPAPSAEFEDVVFPTAAGTKIHAWWCPVAGADSALLYAHGNAGNLSHRGGSVLALQKELGVSVLIFDYPGYGKSQGKPSEAGCYGAADAAYDWLLRVPRLRGEHVCLFGASLGGGVVADLACRRPHRALILAKTFTSLPDVGKALYPWLPVRLLTRTRFDNLRKISQCRQPLVITHGTADTLVPFAHAEKLYAAAGEPKLFYPLPGADHNSPLPLEFFRETRRFLDRSATATEPN